MMPRQSAGIRSSLSLYSHDKREDINHQHFHIKSVHLGWHAGNKQHHHQNRAIFIEIDAGYNSTQNAFNVQIVI